MKWSLLGFMVAGCCVIGCDEKAPAASTPPDSVIILDAPVVKESPTPIFFDASPRVSVSVYESAPRLRTRTVTRTRVDRARRSGGSAGSVASYGSAGSLQRRTKRVDRSVSYGSAGSVSVRASYGSAGGR